MTIEEIRNHGWLLFECVSGSRAYGTDTPESDTDLKGVFVLPPEHYLGLDPVDQISDEKNDCVYYELRRFIELLGSNNPNLIEMLYADAEATLFRDPLFDLLEPGQFLSKICRDSFAGYAMHQVQKARGLNKKIVNPMDKERKKLIDSCHVLEGQGSLPLSEWLSARDWIHEDCGLVKIPHARDVFGLYHSTDPDLVFRGIFGAEDASDVRVSSIPKGLSPDAWMTFNKDGFKKYCKEYHAYWDWVDKRNPARYAANVEHGRNYDSKNMMHTIRLLDMAEEIALTGNLTVRRPNRDELLKIRAGDFTYDELLTRAEAQLTRIRALFAESQLPDRPDRLALERLLVRVRREFWARTR